MSRALNLWTISLPHAAITSNIGFCLAELTLFFRRLSDERKSRQCRRHQEDPRVRFREDQQQLDQQRADGARPQGTDHQHVRGQKRHRLLPDQPGLRQFWFPQKFFDEKLEQRRTGHRGSHHPSLLRRRPLLRPGSSWWRHEKSPIAKIGLREVLTSRHRHWALWT